MEFPSRSMPLDVVVHIQSFLNFNEAARCAMMCKGLYRAWLTNKKIELDERLFRNSDRFWEVAKKTLQRYSDNQLRLETFTIRIISGYERYYQTKLLIKKVASLGARDVKIEILNVDTPFHIPQDLFASQNIESVSLIGGALHAGMELPISATALKSLQLLPDQCIGYKGDLVRNYLKLCPLLKMLHCTSFLLSFDSSIRGRGFQNLMSLTLEDLRNKEALFFTEVFHTFPCLKNLSIRQIYDFEQLRISSESLESLRVLDRYRSVTMELNVPRLRRFEFVGVSWSYFTMEATSSGCAYVIHGVCFIITDSWLSKLGILLQCISSTQVYLTLNLRQADCKFNDDFNVQGQTNVVEHLDLSIDVINPVLV